MCRIYYKYFFTNSFWAEFKIAPIKHVKKSNNINCSVIIEIQVLNLCELSIRAFINSSQNEEVKKLFNINSTRINIQVKKGINLYILRIKYAGKKKQVTCKFRWGKRLRLWFVEVMVSQMRLITTIFRCNEICILDVVSHSSSPKFLHRLI